LFLRVYTASRQQDGAYAAAIQRTVEVLLQSADFLYRVERGAPVSSTYEVVVEVEGQPARRLRGVQVRPGLVRELGSIRFESSAAVRGRVLDASGAPVPGALVRAGRSLGRLDSLVRDEAGHTSSTMSAGDGWFTLGFAASDR
jgi:hypothetical protein